MHKIHLNHPLLPGELPRELLHKGFLLRVPALQDADLENVLQTTHAPHWGQPKHDIDVRLGQRKPAGDAAKDLGPCPVAHTHNGERREKRKRKS